MKLQLGLQLVLPVFLLFALWRGRFISRALWLLNVLAISAALLFAFITARWDFTSYYLRFAFPILLAAAAYISYPKTNAPPEATPRYWWPALLLNAAIFIALAALNARVLWGYQTPKDAIDLAHPLRAGTYYVGGGGNSRFINNHQAYEPEKFALDIVRLNAAGNRASGLRPDALEGYAIFGDTLYSPCSGTVLVAVDGLPDMRPGERDLKNLAGNHVVIGCQGVEVLLAHLKKGSVTVSPAMAIQEGHVLGLVGNSGNTTQPHLHLHAERDGTSGKILTGKGVPLTLNGRFLVRNSLFSRKR